MSKEIICRNVHNEKEVAVNCHNLYECDRSCSHWDKTCEDDVKQAIAVTKEAKFCNGKCDDCPEIQNDTDFCYSVCINPKIAELKKRMETNPEEKPFCEAVITEIRRYIEMTAKEARRKVDDFDFEDVEPEEPKEYYTLSKEEVFWCRDGLQLLVLDLMKHYAGQDRIKQFENLETSLEHLNMIRDSIHELNKVIKEIDEELPF